MKNIASIFLASTLVLTSCKTMNNSETQTQEMPIIDAALSSNPLMKKSSLQYQAPEFDKIKDEHFKPALDYGLKVQQVEIQKIAHQNTTPTFENTVLALENSGEALNRTKLIFSNSTGSNTNSAVQSLDEVIADLLLPGVCSRFFR